eukprot:g35868.t1
MVLYISFLSQDEGFVAVIVSSISLTRPFRLLSTDLGDFGRPIITPKITRIYGWPKGNNMRCRMPDMPEPDVVVVATLVAWSGIHFAYPNTLQRLSRFSIPIKCEMCDWWPRIVTHAFVHHE